MKNVGFIRDIIYQLRLDYGVAAVYFSLEKNEYNAATGNMTMFRKDIPIKKLVKLPSNVLRKVIQDIAYLAANKNFTYGGAYDENSTVVIIEDRNLPKGLKLNANDWMVIENSRYTVSKFEHIVNCVWVVSLHATEGALPYNVHSPHVRSIVTYQQQIVGVL